MGNMSNTSGSGSSSTHREVEVKCHHKIDSKLRMVKTSSNLGKKLYWCYYGLKVGKIREKLN